MITNSRLQLQTWVNHIFWENAFTKLSKLNSGWPSSPILKITTYQNIRSNISWLFCNLVKSSHTNFQPWKMVMRVNYFQLKVKLTLSLWIIMIWALTIGNISIKIIRMVNLEKSQMLISLSLNMMRNLIQILHIGYKSYPSTRIANSGWLHIFSKLILKVRSFQLAKLANKNLIQRKSKKKKKKKVGLSR